MIYRIGPNNHVRVVSDTIHFFIVPPGIKLAEATTSGHCVYLYSSVHLPEGFAGYALHIYDAWESRVSAFNASRFPSHLSTNRGAGISTILPGRVVHYQISTTNTTWVFSTPEGNALQFSIWVNFDRYKKEISTNFEIVEVL